ncbi:alpha/beta fold hydrolase [Streptomyces sp. NPDC003038]|uniref:alpha/beta fold hydrolase n=1 Tax=unclassified Streptomyces TaxID=2593676 RepID=UPI0033A56634
MRSHEPTATPSNPSPGKSTPEAPLEALPPEANGTTSPSARPRNRRRRTVRIALAVLTVLVALLAANAVLVSKQTRQAAGDRIVRLDGGDVHIVESGPPTAPALVLIHGTAGSTHWWDPVMPMLGVHHVVRIDLLGHGGSAKPASGYSVPEQARRIGAVLDRLGIGHAAVVGHSLGGMVATSLADQRRDLVGSLTVIDTGPRNDAFLADSAAGHLLRVPVIAQLLWQLRDSAIRDGLATAFTRPVKIPDQIVDDVRGMTYRSYTSTDRASSAYLRERAMPDRLAGLGLPVMVIYGTRDKRWLPASYESYAGVPRARIERLDGVGHTPMFEEPARTAALIRDFATTGTAH